MAFPALNHVARHGARPRSAAPGIGRCSAPTRRSTSTPTPASAIWSGRSTAAPCSASISTTATAPDEPFSEFRAGLDHVGFGCASRAELESWVDRLDELGIAHGGIVDAHYGSGLSFRDPDGIALEFFAPPE